MNSLPTISLKGKDYVQVKDRILYFNETWTNGDIQTEVKMHGADTVMVKATVTPETKEPERCFIAHSFGVIGPDKAFEKLETVAVGRALAFMGIGVIESVASADEMEQFHERSTPQTPVGPDIIDQDLGTCKKCGAPNTAYKSGKIGCSEYCWKNK